MILHGLWEQVSRGMDELLVVPSTSISLIYVAVTGDEVTREDVVQCLGTIELHHVSNQPMWHQAILYRPDP